MQGVNWRWSGGWPGRPLVRPAAAVESNVMSCTIDGSAKSTKSNQVEECMCPCVTPNPPPGHRFLGIYTAPCFKRRSSNGRRLHLVGLPSRFAAVVGWWRQCCIMETSIISNAIYKAWKLIWGGVVEPNNIRPWACTPLCLIYNLQHALHLWLGAGGWGGIACVA